MPQALTDARDRYAACINIGLIVSSLLSCDALVSGGVGVEDAGTHFTCFTSTKVQMLTQRGGGSEDADTRP